MCLMCPRSYFSSPIIQRETGGFDHFYSQMVRLEAKSLFIAKMLRTLAAMTNNERVKIGFSTGENCLLSVVF